MPALATWTVWAHIEMQLVVDLGQDGILCLGTEASAAKVSHPRGSVHSFVPQQLLLKSFLLGVLLSCLMSFARDANSGHSVF